MQGKAPRPSQNLSGACHKIFGQIKSSMGVNGLENVIWGGWRVGVVVKVSRAHPSKAWRAADWHRRGQGMCGRQLMPSGAWGGGLRP